MSKDLSVGVLLDFYSELLTDKQRDVMDLYYNNDYSLAEIAQNLDISRQGVRDFIKRGEKQLNEFEEKLGMVSRFNAVTQCVKKIDELLNEINRDTVLYGKREIAKQLEDIKKVL